MYCYYCGSKMEDGETVCRNCGAPVKKNEKKNREDVSGDWQEIRPGSNQPQNPKQNRNGGKKPFFWILTGAAAVFLIISTVILVQVVQKKNSSDQSGTEEQTASSARESSDELSVSSIAASVEEEETETSSAREEEQQEAAEPEKEEEEIAEEEEQEVYSLRFNAEDQVQCIVNNFSVWNGENAIEEVSYPYYYLTDLDRDGLLEIGVSSTAGTGIFTRSRMFEITEDLGGLIQVYSGTDDDPEGFADLVPSEDGTDQTVFTGYYDPASGISYHFAENVWRAGWAGYGTSIAEVTMIDNQVQITYIGGSETSVSESGEESTVWRIDDASYDSEASWRDAMRSGYAGGCEEFQYTYRTLNNLSQDTMYSELLSRAQEMS